jgi:hypothetical protein
VTVAGGRGMTEESDSADIAAGRDRVLTAMYDAVDADAALGFQEPCDRTWHESYYECGGIAELFVLVNCECCGQRLLKVCSRCHDSLELWSPSRSVVVTASPRLRSVPTRAG